MSRTIRNPSMLRQLPVSGAAMGRRRAASMLPRGRRRYPDKAGHPFWRARLRCATVQCLAPSSSGPGRRPLKAVAPVQIRSGLLM